MTATVERIEYDPNRTAYIALINYEDNQKLHNFSNGLKVGDKINQVKNQKLKLAIV